MIEGVIITPLKQIPDERGKIMHMLRCDADFFQGFGGKIFSEEHSSAERNDSLSDIKHFQLFFSDRILQCYKREAWHYKADNNRLFKLFRGHRLFVFCQQRKTARNLIF